MFGSRGSARLGPVALACVLVLPVAACSVPAEDPGPPHAPPRAASAAPTPAPGRWIGAAPGHVTPAFPLGSASSFAWQVTAAAMTGPDVPAPARRAYERAEVVMDQVAPRCRLPWTLLAGIGQVESDHGRYGDSVLRPDGVSRPALLGVALDARGSRAKVPDTDGGVLDRDARWDRPVGPMQLLPSTWSVIGVDGDGDGTRSPQDLDDAALAAAAYLCTGAASLDRAGPMRLALLRYNPSSHYAAQVMAYERLYRLHEVVTSVELRAAFAPATPSASGARQLRRATPLVTAVDRRGSHRAVEQGGHVSDPAPTTGGQVAARRPSPTPTTSPAPVPTAPAAPSTGPDPAPEPTPDRTPAVTPGPSPTPPPEPEPDPIPTLATVTGTWEQCDAAYCLDGLQLDVSALTAGETPLGDLDGDGVTEDAAAELLGLVGATVVVSGHVEGEVVSVVTIEEAVLDSEQ